MNKNIIIISINRKMPIKILTSNNRIIIKENFAHFFDISNNKTKQKEFSNINVILKRYKCR